QLVPRGLGGGVLLDPAVADVGHEGPRGDRVDADAVGRELVGSVAHEVLHPGLRGHVGHSDDRLVDFGRVRAGDDDAAAPAVRVGLHRPRRLAHGVEHAVEVDADRLVPALGVVDVYLPVGIALALGGPEAVAD